MYGDRSSAIFEFPRNCHNFLFIISTTSIDSGFCYCCFCGCAPEINRPAHSNTIKSVYWLQQLKIEKKNALITANLTQTHLYSSTALFLHIHMLQSRENCNNTVDLLKLFKLYFKMRSNHNQNEAFHVYAINIQNSSSIAHFTGTFWTKSQSVMLQRTE